MRRLVAIVVGFAAAAAPASCGSSEAPDTPPACLSPSGDYLDALTAAPGPVRLAGTTPISDCLVEEQPGGTLAQVGEPIVAAATQLNRDVREGAPRAEAVQLGYLLGAVEEGASSTGGIHQDLVLRVQSAARYGGPGGRALPPDASAAVDEGYEAGRSAG